MKQISKKKLMCWRKMMLNRPEHLTSGEIKIYNQQFLEMNQILIDLQLQAEIDKQK